MILAWVCLIPYGIFVSRYYKETYSKVFFLQESSLSSGSFYLSSFQFHFTFIFYTLILIFLSQEYWWYSMHVLCMLTAIMFMYGGIYAMEIKRVENINWGDTRILVHIVLGGAAMGIFTIHVFLGFFRLKAIDLRLIQIFLHWFVGHLEYLLASKLCDNFMSGMWSIEINGFYGYAFICLAVASIICSAFIVQGSLPCHAVAFLIGWMIIQLFFFIGMEVCAFSPVEFVQISGYMRNFLIWFLPQQLHVRHLDKMMKITPKRSYLPPPVMRVFHINAPVILEHFLLNLH
jgi:hypothetical protein